MNPFTTHGAISWPELVCPDPKAAAKFYSDVFGWEIQVVPMPDGEYTVANVGGQGQAGIMAKPQPDMPTVWGFYVTVDDIDATLAKAAELGASVEMPVMPVEQVGKLAVISDPQGAFIMMMQYEMPTEGEDAQGYDQVDFTKSFTTHGAFSWFELRTPDPEAAVEFYTKLFGWNVKTDNMGMGPYHIVQVGDVGIGGIIQPPMPGAPPHWGAYVTVDDVDATVEKIKAGGGTVPQDPFEIPKVGRMAMFQDPQGAWLAAIAYVPVEEGTES